MTMNPNPQPNTAQVRELLSPYLDSEVTETERSLLEHELTQSVELRQELESLRQTVAWLASLPKVAAPRPFTLSEADVSPRQKKGYFDWPLWFGCCPHSGIKGMVTASLLVIAVIMAILTQPFGNNSSEVAMDPQSTQVALSNQAEDKPAPELAKQSPKKEVSPETKLTQDEAIKATPSAQPTIPEKKELILEMAAQPAEPPTARGAPLAKAPPVNLAEPTATNTATLTPTVTATPQLTATPSSSPEISPTTSLPWVIIGLIGLVILVVGILGWVKK